MSEHIQLSLFLPDRFDILERRVKKHDLKSIVVAVTDSLNYIDNLCGDMNAAGRGAFPEVLNVEKRDIKIYINDSIKKEI